MSTPPARIPIPEPEYLPAISAWSAIAVRYLHRIDRKSCRKFSPCRCRVSSSPVAHILRFWSSAGRPRPTTQERVDGRIGNLIPGRRRAPCLPREIRSVRVSAYMVVMPRMPNSPLPRRAQWTRKAGLSGITARQWLRGRWLKARSQGTRRTENVVLTDFYIAFSPACFALLSLWLVIVQLNDVWVKG